MIPVHDRAILKILTYKDRTICEYLIGMHFPRMVGRVVRHGSTMMYDHEDYTYVINLDCLLYASVDKISDGGMVSQFLYDKHMGNYSRIDDLLSIIVSCKLGFPCFIRDETLSSFYDSIPIVYTGHHIDLTDDEIQYTVRHQDLDALRKKLNEYFNGDLMFQFYHDFATLLALHNKI